VPLFEDDPLTAFDEKTCLPGNHGKTVSAVARGEFPEGVSVVDAAQSSCGKTGAGADENESEEPVSEESAVDEVEELEVEETEKPAVKAERPGKGADGPSIANERSNGKSNGNGNGNGKRGG
jgi:hypothetical protein